MKITQLVLLFNYQKILLGLLVALGLLWLSKVTPNNFLASLSGLFSALILLNIALSIIASYFLYDKSDLYQLEQLPESLDLSSIDTTLFIHASFDPVSRILEEKYPRLKLRVCDIFENRHLEDKMIKVSKRVFPPHPEEVKIDPTNLPFADNSQDLILAPTSLHEILDHGKRVQFFREAKRVLKPDGTIVISEQMRNWINFAFFNIGAFHFLGRRSWNQAIEESGMVIRETKSITIFAEMLVVERGDHSFASKG